MKQYTEDMLNINDFIEFAKSHVGETHDVRFQSSSKWGQVAGQYTILDFEASDPHFEYSYWKNKDNKTPDGAKLGHYTIRFEGTKFYNGKTLKCPVTAYVQDNDRDDEDNWYITKALHIGNYDIENGKFPKAYCFKILDFKVKA